MKNLLFSIIFTCFFFQENFSYGQEYITKEGKLVFLSKASLSEFTGESKQLSGLVDLENNLLDFYVDLNTIQTGIGLRDRHMRENYLETKKYPFAEFTGKMKSVPELQEGQKMEVNAIGLFKIHGVEKEIEVKGYLTKIKVDQIQLEANFRVLLSDYKIDIPKVMFYELAEEQEVTISAILPKK
jgi:polyisoprenoid-binding protein YceI